LLHAVLKPCSKNYYTDEHGIKGIHKPGINESRESMVMHVKTQAEVTSSIAKFRESLKKVNLRVQPYVIAVGPTLTSITKFLTVIEDLVFEFDNLVSALDSCFKGVFVFSLEFQKESFRVWHFFQEYFYWPLERIKRNAEIIMLSKSLKNKQ
jgi:hypothetical protein